MDEYPKPVSKSCIEKIFNQMNNSIYKIKGKDGEFQIGIFCKLKFDKNIIFVLITTNKIINKGYLKDNDGINISINNKNRFIEFGHLKYINKEYDLSIIEIRNNPNYKIYFLELDDSLYEKAPEFSYNKEPIYILHYGNKNNITVSYGIMKYINKYKLICSCNNNLKEKGSPIFNLSTNKLIGLYINKSNYYNKGLFLNIIINEFFYKYKNSKYKIFNGFTNKNDKSSNEIKYKNSINEITKELDNKNDNSTNEIEILIDVSNIDKEIYFLDNYKRYEYKNNICVESIHDNLKELNELNTELFIDNKKYKFKKYFKPEKNGKYNIKLKFNVNLTDSSYMFAGCRNITNIKFITFNTKCIINMNSMFRECSNLSDLDLFYFDTRNVTDMGSMFCDCSLHYLDLSSFDTRNVTDMSSMFLGCCSLSDIDLSSFDTRNVTDMNNMFCECKNLINLNLFNFDTSKVTDMSYMFRGLDYIRRLDLCSFNTRNVASMRYMFQYCKNLSDLDLSYFDVENVKNFRNIEGMFYECQNNYQFMGKIFDLLRKKSQK